MVIKVISGRRAEYWAALSRKQKKDTVSVTPEQCPYDDMEIWRRNILR